MSNFKDVKTFMKTFGQMVKAKPQFPDGKTMQLRFDLIKEELIYWLIMLVVIFPSISQKFKRKIWNNLLN